MKKMTMFRAGRLRCRAVCVAGCMVALFAAPVRAEDVPPDVQTEADTIWQSRCSTCHGAAGKGDGAAAAALTPKPRDFSSASWQASVSDEHIEKIIAEGGQSVGLSMLMPANPDLVAKPAVIKALRAHVRGLAVH